MCLACTTSGRVMWSVGRSIILLWNAYTGAGRVACRRGMLLWSAFRGAGRVACCSCCYCGMLLWSALRGVGRVACRCGMLLWSALWGAGHIACCHGMLLWSACTGAGRARARFPLTIGRAAGVCLVWGTSMAGPGSSCCGQVRRESQGTVGGTCQGTLAHQGWTSPNPNPKGSLT